MFNLVYLPVHLGKDGFHLVLVLLIPESVDQPPDLPGPPLVHPLEPSLLFLAAVAEGGPKLDLEEP